MAQAFHWGSAFLILTLIPLGLVMARLGESSLKTNLYRAHAGSGLLVLLITALRILWRFIDPTPEVPAGMSPLPRFGFKAVHFLLYLALVLLLLSGAGILLVSGVDLSPAGVLPEAISQSDKSLDAVFASRGKVAAKVVNDRVHRVFERQLRKRGARQGRPSLPCRAKARATAPPIAPPPPCLSGGVPLCLW